MAARKPRLSRMPRKIMPNASPAMDPVVVMVVVGEGGGSGGDGSGCGCGCRGRW